MAVRAISRPIKMRSAAIRAMYVSKMCARRRRSLGVALILWLLLCRSAAASGDVLPADFVGADQGAGQAVAVSTESEDGLSAVLYPPGESDGYRLYVVVGESMILQATDVTRVAVADPAIADVVVASRTEVLINGVAPGRTTLHVWDQSGRSSFALRVYEDGTEMAREIEHRIGAPNLVVWVAKGTVILEGVVAGEKERERALKIAGVYSDRVVDLIRVPATDLDAATTAAIIQAVDDPDVRVTVVNGTALVEGTVQTELQRARAESIAQAYTDEVTNLIRVAPQKPTIDTGPAGLSGLRDEIMKGIADSDVHVRVFGDTVFLEGQVDEAFAKERARAIAQAYHHDVVDLLRVAPKEPEVPRPQAHGVAPVLAAGALEDADPVERNEAATGAGGATDGDRGGIAAGAESAKGAGAGDVSRAALGTLADRLEALRQALDEPEIRLTPMGESTVVLDGRASSPHGQERAKKLAGLYFAEVIDVTRVSGPEDAGQPGLAQVVAAAVAEPTVRVRAAGGKVILEGSVVDQNALERLLAIAGSYGDEVISLVEVTDPVQVLLQVRVLELDKKASHQLGTTWGSLDRGIISPRVFYAGELAMGSPIVRLKTLIAQIDTMVDSGDAKILAQPSLLTLSGEEASFLAGGEIPVVIPQDDKLVVEWKEYGVRLKMKPTVDSEDRVSVEINPEVSTLDWANGVRVNNAVLPALRTRRVQSVLRVKDGETLVVGGLINSEESSQVAKLPVLGDLPIIGKLFSSEKFSQNETELLFFITPRVVRDEDLDDIHDLVAPDGATS